MLIKMAGESQDQQVKRVLRNSKGEVLLCYRKHVSVNEHNKLLQAKSELTQTSSIF